MDSSPHYYMHRPSKYYADALLLLAVLVVLFCLDPSVFAGDLKSGTFVGLLEDGKNNDSVRMRELFNLTVPFDIVFSITLRF